MNLGRAARGGAGVVGYWPELGSHSLRTSYTVGIAVSVHLDLSVANQEDTPWPGLEFPLEASRSVTCRGPP